VERQYESGSFALEADPDLLYRAFVNLFANALQAMPEGAYCESGPPCQWQGQPAKLS